MECYQSLTGQRANRLNRLNRYLYFQNKPDRTMIGTENIVVDEGLFDPAFINHILGHEKIIDAPPDIAIPGFKAVGPP